MTRIPQPDPIDRPTWVERVDNPYLQGIHTPSDQETTAFELRIEGELPQDLYGA